MTLAFRLLQLTGHLGCSNGMGVGLGKRRTLLLSGAACKRHLLCVPFLYARAAHLSFSSVRMDLGKMYQRGEFILLPTLKTFADAKAFIQKAGYSDRDGEDDSPRRPMTAVSDKLVML